MLRYEEKIEMSEKKQFKGSVFSRLQVRGAGKEAIQMVVQEYLSKSNIFLSRSFIN